MEKSSPNLSSDNASLCSLVVREKEDGEGSEIGWSNSNHWVEASIALLGSKGRMLATSPSIVAHMPPSTVPTIVGDSIQPSTRQSNDSTSNEDQGGIDGQSREIVSVSIHTLCDCSWGLNDDAWHKYQNSVL